MVCLDVMGRENYNTENLEIFARLRGTAAPNAVKNALEVVGLPYRDKKLFGRYFPTMKSLDK